MSCVLQLVCSYIYNNIYNESTYVLMPRWGWMIVAHINCRWTHNTCSSKGKTHADALNNYWVSRQTEHKAAVYCPQEVTV